MTISCKVIAKSVSPSLIEIATIEIEYPRFILAELNTHRMLSKNSASSRAIPIRKVHEYIRNSPAIPVEWGKNQAGMSARELLSKEEAAAAKEIWLNGIDSAIFHSLVLAEQYNVHKQIANRITEPWMTMKSVVTATNWLNFFELRAHPDAQPEFRELAYAIKDELDATTPQKLEEGEWHVPYVQTDRNKDGVLEYYDQFGKLLSLEDAKTISASCCAQVSYRKNDDTLEKAKQVFDRLMSTPMHASPIEHQATPMVNASLKDPGVTHLTKSGDLYSANFRGWIQNRQLYANESVKN